MHIQRLLELWQVEDTEEAQKFRLRQEEVSCLSQVGEKDQYIVLYSS